MKQRSLYVLFIAFCFFVLNDAKAQNSRIEETIFVFGGDINKKFIQYVAGLTKKENPRLCFLPTASGDNENNIKYWENECRKIGIEPVTLRVWVSASGTNKSFEDILLHSDGIIVGGGNTLNMLGIWKAQGIDTILKKALKKGIVLAGGSAGSICWFQNGISDSRPTHLSSVTGLGFLHYSNCPHYSNEGRKNKYHQMIKDRQMFAGYANDDLAGILFRNGKAVEFVSQSDKHHSYFVKAEKGIIKSTRIESKILIDKDALQDNAYTSLSVNQKIRELLRIEDITSPSNAYALEIKKLQLSNDSISDVKRNKVLDIAIEKVFVYKNKLAGIINDAYTSSFGYGLWYFYNCNGSWKSLGEDIGGETLFESEITFRERAKTMIELGEKKYGCE